jgi:hypothetical protein
MVQAHPVVHSNKPPAIRLAWPRGRTRLVDVGWRIRHAAPHFPGTSGVASEFPARHALLNLDTDVLHSLIRSPASLVLP